jgi:hypothetical protein
MGSRSRTTLAQDGRVQYIQGKKIYVKKLQKDINNTKLSERSNCSAPWVLGLFFLEGAVLCAACS